MSLPDYAPLGSVPRLTDYPPRFHGKPSVRERKSRRRRRRLSREVGAILDMPRGKSMRALLGLKVE